MLKNSFNIKIVMLVVTSLAYTSISAQSTFSKVYSILQTSCTASSCHDNTSMAAGLSLIGTGVDPEGDVYNSLVEQTPTNTYAATQGYVRANPGDPHTSFLFRVINDDFDDHITLDPQEGSHPALPGLADVDKELIRQWILFGAPENGTVVDTSIIQDYYTLGGVQSMPTRPAAPAAGEGFQIHFGPFFIPPSTEQEYYLKFDPGFADTLESNRIDILMSTNSHHFILDRFTQGNETNVEEGYRVNAAHLETEGITAAQFPGPQYLPPNTAFLLPEAAWLDLNSHYINFSTDSILKAEVYVNIYTQPHGTAKQIMYTGGGLGALAPPFLNVPNDGATYTFEASWHSGSTFPLANDVYVWTMNSHTHQWGTDFDIYERSLTGLRGDKLFDATNLEGDPLGIPFMYDYTEPPSRVFDPFLFVDKDEGFIFEASYVNTGPNNNVGWGVTSEDEMFIMGIYYVLDTAGLSVTGIPGAKSEDGEISVYPNPAQSKVFFEFKDDVTGTVEIYSSLGLLVEELDINGKSSAVDVADLPVGVYVYQITSDIYSKSGRFTVTR